MTDRLAACPTARCHVCLQTVVWTGPLEPRQTKGQKDKEAALLGEAGNCEKTLRDVDRISLLPVSWPRGLRQRLRWDEMFRLRGWKWRRKGGGGVVSIWIKMSFAKTKGNIPSNNLKASAEFYLHF